MTLLLAIISREFGAYFRVPLGWVVVATFLAFSSIFFVTRTLIPGEPATMQLFFNVWWALLLFVAPAISMRLLAEEFRSGSIEPLLTAPLGEATLVAGKFFSAVLFLLAMLAPTLIYVGVLEFLARPDPGPVAAGYLGLVLLGTLYLAVGTLASALTSSQTLAFLGTLLTLIAVDVAPGLLAPHVSERVAGVLFQLSPNIRTADFARGLIRTSNIVFFLTASFWFLAAAALVLRSRRWR